MHACSFYPVFHDCAAFSLVPHLHLVSHLHIGAGWMESPGSTGIQMSSVVMVHNLHIVHTVGLKDTQTGWVFNSARLWSLSFILKHMRLIRLEAIMCILEFSCSLFFFFNLDPLYFDLVMYIPHIVVCSLCLWQILSFLLCPLWKHSHACGSIKAEDCSFDASV